MIERVEFKNYRVLRDTNLPLGPFTMLVGPNGSGKSTVLHALRSLRTMANGKDVEMASVSSIHNPRATTSVCVTITDQQAQSRLCAVWDGALSGRFKGGEPLWAGVANIRNIRTYALNENAIAKPAFLQPDIQLGEDGSNLAGVLDRMRDEDPEAFEHLNQELESLLPEFNRILFETPGKGSRGFLLRTHEGLRSLRAIDVSQGTLLALTILTLAYLRPVPSMICIEEPDRGIHPRLYREIRDALYRLSYPENFGLDRPPVQVLITSHSPYMLDLHRDHPEEVVIAEKVGSEGTFSRLSDREDLEDLLSEATLGEIWYSGVLGGVPAGT
jgi:predicted ATPase